MIHNKSLEVTLLAATATHFLFAFRTLRDKMCYAGQALGQPAKTLAILRSE